MLFRNRDDSKVNGEHRVSFLTSKPSDSSLPDLDLDLEEQVLPFPPLPLLLDFPVSLRSLRASSLASPALTGTEAVKKRVRTAVLNIVSI